MTIASGARDGPPDAELLGRFGGGGPEAEAAFAALVRRHGPMVLRVCRAAMGHEHDARDAFQAAFLVLLRRAGSIRDPSALAPWLHGVALRVCRSARSAAARRRAHERRAAAERGPGAEGPGAEGPGAVVQEELGRLPPRFREALVLCDLAGLTHEQAAAQLGCPVGTVKSRLARGRARLRGRLQRRGLAPAGAAALGGGAAPAAVPEALAARVAGLAAGGAAGAAPAAVRALARAAGRRAASAAWLRLAAGLAALLGGVATLAGLALPARPAAGSRDLLREAARAARAEATEPMRLMTAVIIARAQARAGDAAGALATLRGLPGEADALPGPRRCDVLTAAAWALGEAGDRAAGLQALAHARRCASELEPAAARSPALRLVAAAQRDLGDRRAAAATAATLAEPVLALRRRGVTLVDGPALEWVAALAELGDDDGAFRAAEVAAGPWRLARGQLLGRMAEASAGSVVWFMQPRRAPDAAARAARRRAVARIAAAAEATAPAGRRADLSGRRPDLELALALAEVGDFAAALRCARRIGGPTSWERAFALGRVGMAQGRDGRPEPARRTFAEAVQVVAGAPGLAPRLAQLAAMQAEGGDLDGALGTAAAADRDARPGLLGQVARRRRRAGDFEAARATARRAVRLAEESLRDAPAGPTGGAPGRGRVDRLRAELAALHAGLGEPMAADRTYAAIAGAEARGWAARDVARARAEAGDLAGALDWARSLHSPAERLGALGGLADASAPP